MPKTIYDIAKSAGVSIATVSRVFNEAERVKPATREKILKVADQMGYQPHVYAQSLASKNKKRIMMLVPVMSNYFLTEILRGVQDSLSKHQIELSIVNINHDGNPFAQVEMHLKKRWAEGYLFVSLHLPEKKLKSLKRYDVPISLVDDYSAHFDSVSFDNREGAMIATDYLLKKGHRRIALLSAREDSIPIIGRLEGYKQALSDNKMEFDSSLVFTGENMERDGFTELSGYQGMKKILKSKKVPDACFCMSDIKAVGAQKAMREAGRRIPMISFDNLSISEYVELSTVSQPMYRMGHNATEKLISRLQEDNGEMSLSHEIFKPELIIRKSSEPDLNKRVVV
ncbi:MAG: LacI family DNA-binding transcriptional regulator [Balneolaceae bacterium]|nr:LacI family DNA-binding transcriptional regulator [Balneolaceae bacterium]MCH8549830.1 LacI family transcriptional regulator [Balneolaceae bacterium]